MSDLIRREDAIDAMAELQGIAQSKAELTGISKAWKRIKVLPTASPWHRVEERLPNVGELVVGLDAYGHAEITMLSESKCWLTYGLYIHNLGCYVWWMPLPEPPKEDVDANK